MGWSYVSPLLDSDGTGQDMPLCFLSMHLVFSYFIPQIKSHATPPLLSLYSNRRVKLEVNSWIWGNNSHMGLQIMMCFDWAFVIAIVIAQECLGRYRQWWDLSMTLFRWLLDVSEPFALLISSDKVRSKQAETDIHTSVACTYLNFFFF